MGCVAAKVENVSYAEIQQQDEEDDQFEDPFYSIFKSSSLECKSAHTCDSLKRLSIALKHYISLDVINNMDDNTHFTKFCNSIYKSLLDDYIHIITTHDTDLLQISQIMSNDYMLDACCDINECRMIHRHYNYLYTDEHKQWSDDLLFYVHIMDSMHCYVFHSYDIGFRVNINTHEHDDILYNNKLPCFDDLFSNICTEIQRKIKQLNTSNAWHEYKMKSNKFTLNMNNFDHHMFRDDLYSFMRHKNGIHSHEMDRMKQVFMDEEYDSDAIQNDIELTEKHSNIAQYFKHNKYYHLIHDYIHNHDSNYVYTESVNVGLKFFYWKHYKTSKQYTFNGYKECDLFISHKYATLKEEILTNNIFALELHKYTQFVHKTTKYMQSIKVKKCMCFVDDDPLLYDIQFGDKLSFANVLCMILLCDSIQLSLQFKRTFRRNNVYEDIKSVKDRNIEYYHWSKTVRETVEYFGDPFCRTNHSVYVHIPLIVITSQFYMNLNSVVSVSKYIEVIQSLSDYDGVIVELNDTGTWHDVIGLDTFNCSWMSRYIEENEMIFCGGNYRIRMQSVYNIETKQNFKVLFRSLFSFEFMIHGNDVEDFVNKPHIEPLDYDILDGLMKQRLRINGFKNKYPKYINHTFDTFTLNITQIDINLDFIERYFKILKNLIVYSTEIGVNNVPKEIVWKVFPNIKYMVIYTTDNDGQYSEYPLNLVAFMASLCKSSGYIRNDIVISIKGTHKYEFNAHVMKFVWVERSWIFDVFSDSLQQFANNGFSADLREETREDANGNTRKVDCLVIRKL